MGLKRDLCDQKGKEENPYNLHQNHPAPGKTVQRSISSKEKLHSSKTGLEK